MSIDFPDEYLSERWEHIDWDAASEKLATLQRDLTIATYRRDRRSIEDLQNRIVNDVDIKCLAVRHVCNSTMSPGVDGVKWKTPAEKMRAAFSLTSKDYHASPMRQILIKAKNTGKERRPRIPTYYDRSMNVLYGYSLIPVTEAMAERKSFAFRPGRSTQDAHEYVMAAIKGARAPEFIVYGDIKAYYSHIQHAWLLKHVPMDKQVLSEFLNAGIVFAGELFPPEDEGISEGSNIAPYLGNFVLDGLQKQIYRGLHGTSSPDDYANGNLIRFADDILITVRMEEDAQTVLETLCAFLDERGLTLSEEKTGVSNIKDGFTFLSRTYIKKNNMIYCYPADCAVERFIDDLVTTIQTHKKSQRDLILLLNRKLKGWAGYHRYSDALDAFKRVDTAVQTALLDNAIKRHPRMAPAKVIAKYWYKESNGKHSYALPDDKSVRIIRLEDTILLTHQKIKTNANPFVDKDYTEQRTHIREIQNVTGVYRAVWERQSGRCYYCGRPILIDQPRTVVPLNLSKVPSAKNSAYIHSICAHNDFQIVKTMEDISLISPYDVYSILEDVAENITPCGRRKKPPQSNWRHYPVKNFFEKAIAASITLTFQEIERLEGKPLPERAWKDRDYWYRRKDCNTIAEAWRSEDYVMTRLDLKRGKITLHREKGGVSKLEIPDIILNGQLPDNAVQELKTHMEYIIKRYALDKALK